MLHGASEPPPRTLIHLHIRKTGGTSLNSAIKHAFRPHEVFQLYADGDCEHGALDIASIDGISRLLAGFGLDRLRYVNGHVPFGVHRLFSSSTKYVTLVRDPIDRVISTFFWFRAGRPFCVAGRPLTFEEYVASGNDIYLSNYQVRVLSGAPEFHHVVSRAEGRELTFGPPVERRHLEQAKRNIENYFLLAAPLERLTEVVLFLRIIYGWPMRRLQNEYKNQNQDRPSAREVSPTLIELIKRNNTYDIELYQWVKDRFAAQRMLVEPQLSEDLARFQSINRIITGFGKYLPQRFRKQVAAVVLHGRGAAVAHTLLRTLLTACPTAKLFERQAKWSRRANI
jgi:hypothetical protein